MDRVINRRKKRKILPTTQRNTANLAQITSEKETRQHR